MHYYTYNGDRTGSLHQENLKKKTSRKSVAFFIGGQNVNFNLLFTSLNQDRVI